jgi:N-acetylneuraminic acid mutarotase
MNMRSSLLLAGLALTLSVSAQETWTARSSFPGLPRWGVACFDINGIGYLVGGRTAANVDLNELWAYDPATDTWQQKTSIPGTLRMPSAFALGGKGYVTCGLSGSGTHLNATWQYDPATDSWASKATFPGSARFSAASFILNGQAYVCSGNTGSANGPYMSDLWKYDPVQDQWLSRAALPDQGRVGATGFSADGKGYVLGGRQQDQTFTNELWAYDPTTNSWSVRASIPGDGISDPQTYSVGNRGVVVGGHGVLSDPFTCWYYTPGTNSWTALPNYVGNGTWTGANMAIDQRIFMGLGQASGNVFGDFYELTNLFLGVGDLSSGSSISLFPNPCRSGGQVEVELARAGTKSQLKLLNNLGQLVFTTEISDMRQVVTLPQLPTGSYVCVIMQNGVPVGRSELSILQ